MEVLKDIRAVLDLGVTAMLGFGLLYIVYRPPTWIRTVVDSHHTLAEGVKTMSEVVKDMPKREEIQELLIGQEALRRETGEVKDELRSLRRDLRG